MDENESNAQQAVSEKRDEDFCCDSQTCQAAARTHYRETSGGGFRAVPPNLLLPSTPPIDSEQAERFFLLAVGIIRRWAIVERCDLGKAARYVNHFERLMGITKL